MSSASSRHRIYSALNGTYCCSDQLNSEGGNVTGDIPDYFKLLATVYLIIVDFLIVSGNSWVLFIILSRQRKSMYVLSSLVVSDFLTGVTSIPLYLIWLHHKELFSSLPMCYATLMVALFLSVASILNIIAVTMERFIAICYPLLYKTHIKVSFNRTLSLVVGSIWTASLIVSVLSMTFMRTDYTVCSYYTVFQEQFLLWTITIGVFVPLCLLVLVYVKILFSVRESMNSHHTGTPATSDSGSFRHKALKRLIITLFLVLSCFIICWCPLLITVVVLVLCKQCQLPKIAYETILLLGFTNSLANVFIYCLRHKSFRRINSKSICTVTVDSPQSFEMEEFVAQRDKNDS